MQTRCHCAGRLVCVVVRRKQAHSAKVPILRSWRRVRNVGSSPKCRRRDVAGFKRISSSATRRVSYRVRNEKLSLKLNSRGRSRKRSYFQRFQESHEGIALWLGTPNYRAIQIQASPIASLFNRKNHQHLNGPAAANGVEPITYQI